jgi:hypothetical protein
MKQCDAELINLTGTQKDCQELLDNARLTTSNARSAIAKHLNI